MKFETAWRDGYEFFERVHNSLLNHSVKRKIDLPHEWYEPNSRGLYSSISDPEMKFEKKQGRAKDGRDHYGYTDPIYRSIRENYWQTDYNPNPRVWYLDIETRSGRSYKNAPIGELTIKNTRTQKESTLAVKNIQDTFYNFGEEAFAYLVKGEWRPLRENFYMQRNKGFPAPEKAQEQVSMIQIFDSELKEVIMIGTRKWVHKSDYEALMEYPVKYINAEAELKLFEIYTHLFKSLDPLIVYAWNGLGFDFPYLFNRMENLGLNPNDMSNYGEVKLVQSEFQGRTEFRISTPGHHYIDMLDAYQHYIKAPRNSYALDNIAEIELKENKVSHSEYAQFDHFYLGQYNIPDNPTEEQKNSKIYQLAIKEGLTDEVRELGHSEFCWYSYKDPLLIMKLDQKLNFTSLIVRTAERMGVLLSDSFGTVRPWSQYIANIALQRNQVLPPTQDRPQPNVTGGYVMDPVRGKKQWVLSSDVASMYPLLGMTGFNMSPETIVSVDKLPPELRDIILSYFNDQDEGKLLDYPEEVWEVTSALLKEHNLCLGINGAVFTTEKTGIIPELVLGIYNERKATRKIESKYKNQRLLIEDILHEKTK